MAFYFQVMCLFANKIDLSILFTTIQNSNPPFILLLLLLMDGIRFRKARDKISPWRFFQAGRRGPHMEHLSPR